MGVQTWEESFEHFNVERLPEDDSTGSGYGDWFTYTRSMAQLVEELGPTRGAMTYYEQLHEDFAAELHRIAAMLKVPMSQAKLKAIAEYVSFDAMAAGKVPGGQRNNRFGNVLMRKGIVGDHVNYLTPGHWQRMENIFEGRLGDVPLAQPLRRWMSASGKARL